MLQGRVGSEVDLDGGYRAARQTGLALLSTLRNHLGSLDRVVRVIKVLGLVNSSPDFQNPEPRTQLPTNPANCSEPRTEIMNAEAKMLTTQYPELPPPPAPAGVYKPILIVDNLKPTFPGTVNVCSRWIHAAGHRGRIRRSIWTECYRAASQTVF